MAENRDTDVRPQGTDLGGWNSFPEGPLLAGPLHGECSERDALLWAQARDTSPLTLHIADAGGERTLTETPDAAQWQCVVFQIPDLQPATLYDYWLTSAYGTTPRYSLRTAPPASAQRLRIAFGSCYKDYTNPGLTIFDAIAREGIDLFLMLGDSCYFTETDWSSEHAMMLGHLRNRNNPAPRRLLPSTPTLAIWDDHDFGPNDSDSTFPHREWSLRCWRRLWAQRAYGTPALQAVFSTVRYGPVELLLTDGRSFRRERRHILGAEQLDWLQDALRRSAAPVKLILSGSQVLPEVAMLPHFDWECWRRDAPQELAALLAFIERNDIRGVIFLSGDPHLGHLLHASGRAFDAGRKGPEFWELTASPLANNPWSKPVMPADSQPEHCFDRYLLAEVVAHNYGVVDIDLGRAGAEIRLELHGDQGQPQVVQTVALQSLQVRPATPKVAAAAWSEDKAYVFRGEHYIRCDVTAGQVTARDPRPVAAGWKGVWPEGLGAGIDAILPTTKGKVYFFKGNGYVRYDVARDQADSGYPKYIGSHFCGVWPDGLDAVIAWPGGKAYFFKGSECIRYDIAQDRADPGYPRAISEEFPGLWPGGIDMGVAWPDGKVYFTSGDECIRYDVQAGQVEAGYPKPLGEGWLGFLV